MRSLRKLRDLGGDKAPAPAVPEDVPACEHVVLVPRWERDSLASEYKCEACGAEFTPTEVQSLRATEAARAEDIGKDDERLG